MSYGWWARRRDDENGGGNFRNFNKGFSLDGNRSIRWSVDNRGSGLGLNMLDELRAITQAGKWLRCKQVRYSKYNYKDLRTMSYI